MKEMKPFIMESAVAILLMCTSFFVKIGYYSMMVFPAGFGMAALFVGQVMVFFLLFFSILDCPKVLQNTGQRMRSIPVYFMAGALHNDQTIVAHHFVEMFGAF